MSSDFSQLPANCSSDLQQFFLGKSEDEMLSSLENNPEKLLDFFEVACADLQWQQNNNALFQRVAEKITSAEESHRYNSEQINKISGICEGILTSSEQNPIQKPIIDVYRHSLNLEHALNMVTKEGLDPSPAVVKQCRTYIEEQTYQKISRDSDDKIEIKITQINKETNQLIALISEWDVDKRSKINIHLSTEKSISKEDSDVLAEKYGKFANSLTLDKNVQDNEHLENLFKNFTQINRLVIQSDQITALPQLPHSEKLTSLVCSRCPIEKLPPEYTQLTYLVCHGCPIKELPPEYTQLTYLVCNGSSIEKLPPEYTRLTELNCDYCSIKELPPEYTQLTNLTCADTLIKELPSTYTQLTGLSCNECPIEKLPPEYTQLTNLACAGTLIKELPPEYTQLTELECCGSPIENLPPEYTQLTELVCRGCPIKELPPEYTQLTYLICNGSSIEKLPPEYTQLTYLACNRCPIEKLPPEYTQLTYLACNRCPIKELPSTYTQLTYLTCGDCDNLTHLSKYKLLSKIYQGNPDIAKNFASTMGLSLEKLSVFSHFTQIHDALPEEFLEALEELDAIGISRQIENKNLLKIIGEIVPDDSLQQLYLYHLSAKVGELDDEEKLKTFLKLVVRSPMDKELRSFYLHVSQAEILHIPDNLSTMDEWSHPDRLQTLSYLLLIDDGWEDVIKNTSQLLKSGLWEDFQQSFPPNRFVAEFLQTHDLFSGNREKDSQAIVALNSISAIIKEGVSRLLEKTDAEIKALLESSVGKILTRVMAKDFLAESRLQNIVKELYPPNDPINVALYPIQAKMTGHTLDLTIIPEMPLFYPDSIFAKFSQYEQAQGFFIKHYASGGIDQGGMRRQFVAQTMQGIQNRSKNFSFEKIKSKDTGITSVIPVPAFNPYFTMTQESVQAGKAQEKENYRVLGRFLGLALRNRTPIGRVFHPKFFETTLLFTDADLNRSDFSAKDYLAEKKPQELLDFIKEYLTESEETPGLQELFANVQAALKAEDLNDLKELAEDLNKIWLEDSLEDVLESEDKEKIKECVVDILAETYYYGRLEVMHAMAKGMRDALPFQVGDTHLTKWNDVQFVETEQFGDALQGKLSLDWIKQNLSFKPEDSEKAEQVKQWIHGWLDDNKDNPEALSNVIVTFTGSTALATPIVFHLEPEVQSIYPHTCFNSVDVPLDIDEAGLRSALDSWGNNPEIEMTRA